MTSHLNLGRDNWTTADSTRAFHAASIAILVAVSLWGCSGSAPTTEGTGGSMAAAGGNSAGGNSGRGGTSNNGGSASLGGTTGTVSNPCGGCAATEICVFQSGGPGPAHYTCATQLPCGAAGICACIVNQGTCTFVPNDTGTIGTCLCDNGLD